MPTLMPFRAWRYAPAFDLGAVTAPPYDVLAGADIIRYRARDPQNIVYVDIPEQTPDGYASAALTLHYWMAHGTMVRDDVPTLTLYRLSFIDSAGSRRSMLGVLGALPVVDYGDGGVLPHEHVTLKASTDRLDLTRATGANLSPIWGLSLASGLVDALEGAWAAAIAAGERPAGFTDAGVTHEVLPVSDAAAIAAIQRLLESADVLIADGHHRYGVAQRYRDEVRATEPSNAAGPAEFTLAFVSELVADQLNIDAIHRVYDGVAFDGLAAALSGWFELTPAQAPTSATLDHMAALGRLVLLAPDGRAWWLTPRPGAFDGVRALDGLWLEQALAGVDGLQVTYQHGLSEVLELLPQHSGAVLIRPTSIAEIRRTATEGLLMPPKSTFFTPKLQTGLVIRSLDHCAD